MTWAAIIAMVVMGLPMICLGWRWGGVRMLWLLAWFLLLDGAAWACVLHSLWLAGLLAIASVALLALGIRVMRRARRERTEDVGELASVGGLTGRLDRYWQGVQMTNRGLGVAVGVVMAAMFCLTVATLTTAIIQGGDVVQACRQDRGTPAPPPRSVWADRVVATCRSMAELSTDGVLQHVPYLDEYSREVVATIDILNADQESLAWLARQYDLKGLSTERVVRDAMDDEAYRELIDEAKHGHPSAFRKLRDHPLTHELMANERVRTYVRRLKPSEMRRRLKEHQAEKARQAASPKDPVTAETLDTPRQDVTTQASD